MKVSTHRIAGDIAVTVRSPDASGTAPAIILCHGFCGIQDVLLPDYADAFAATGFVAVTFDYRGFGASGGERGRLVPAMQIDDVRAVLAWTGTQTHVDRTRIGLWGTSLGGCHVVAVAANNPDVACIVSQLPFADGEDIVTGTLSDGEKRAFVETLDRMEAKQRSTGREMFVGVTRVLSDEESKAFFETVKARHPEMDVKIPFLTVREMLQYKPKTFATDVTAPTLVVVAGQDRVNPPEQGVALFEAVGARRKELHVEPEAKHYDLYEAPFFNGIVERQIGWLRQILMAPR